MSMEIKECPKNRNALQATFFNTSQLQIHTVENTDRAKSRKKRNE